MSTATTTIGTPTRRELRQFGCGMGLLFGLVGGALYWQGRSGAGLFLAAALTGIAFWFAWPGTRPLYQVWMCIATGLGRVVTTILLTLVYLLLLTPLALLARCLGKRFLSLSPQAEILSYWTIRPKGEADPDACTRQY